MDSSNKFLMVSHGRLLLPWLRVPCWFFCNQGLKNCRHGRGIKPTNLGLSSQSSAQRNDIKRAGASPQAGAKTARVSVLHGFKCWEYLWLAKGYIYFIMLGVYWPSKIFLTIWSTGAFDFKSGLKGCCQDLNFKPDFQPVVSTTFYLLYIKNGCTDVCLSVCLLLCGGLMEIQIPSTDLDEILHTHPHLSKEGFGPGVTPVPSSLGPGGLETL